MPVASPLMGATILVVEREPRLRAAVTEALDLSGCMVLQADSTEGALSALEERSDVRVVVADTGVADASDVLAFAHEAHQRWPALGMVITSAQVRHLHPSELPGEGIFMPRPLPVDAFLEAISFVACLPRTAAFRGEI